MSGQSVFEDMVNEMTSYKGPFKTTDVKVSKEDYELWRRDFIWEALHGQRFGQSFCNRFGITDNHLYYNNGDINWADAYIRKNYLERS